MMYSDDTICAISTPAGVGGIAVIRVSGSRTLEIVDTIWKGRSLTATEGNRLRYGEIIDPDNGFLDQAVAAVYRAPHSYTGEDVVELSVHGSEWIQQELVRLLIRRGCRLAQAGEFTRRAFVNGKLDLTEAEAVADMIAASSRAAHRIATTHLRGGFSQELARLRDEMLQLAALLELELDFSEEDVEFASREQLLALAHEVRDCVGQLVSSFAAGNAIKNGVTVAIVGATNAGKSTLLNRLLGEQRAIVSDIHGTTRDTIEDTVEIHDTLFRFIDTAGLRDTTDEIEQIGIQRAKEKIAKASIILWLVAPESIGSYDDEQRLISELRSEDSAVIIALNKCDLGSIELPAAPTAETIAISAKTGDGIDRLKELLVEKSEAFKALRGDIMISNVRHYEALKSALNDIERVIQGLESNLSGDFVAQDLRACLNTLGEITGEVTTSDILAHVFSHFCIGK